MKNLILFVFFLIFSQLTFSQYSSIFGTSSTSWNIFNKSPGSNSVDSLFTNGNDTIINGNVYKQVNSYKVINSTTKWLNSTSYFIRENVVNGRVWIRNSMDTSELLIADLSLSVGDTLFFDKLRYGIVDSTYSVGLKKHIRLNYFPYSNCNELQNEKYTMIEGVGFISFLRQTLSNGTCEFLLCKKKDGAVIYQNSNSSYSGYCNSNFLGVEDNISQNDIVIYPNPTTNEITILSENKKISSISIVDVFGKQIKFISTNSNKENIDISTLPKGMYIVTIYSNEKIIIKRVIRN